MSIVTNYTDLIGKTPILQLVRYRKAFGLYADIYLKLENFNPLSSVKDRLAFALVEALEERKLICSTTTIIEPSSGNTGIGLAFVCAAKGYKLIITGPESMSKERVKIMRALGATVILTPQENGMKGAIAKAKELQSALIDAVIPQQFENLANPAMHRKTTALEILQDFPDGIDFFVAGVGTGGTITGVGEILKEHFPHTSIVAVEPAASAVLSGNAPSPHKIQGIGAGFIPSVLNTKVIDKIIQVENEEAFNSARTLAKTEGVLGGISGGAALHAATLLAKEKENENKKILVILPDTGERYLSTMLYQEEEEDV